MGFVRTKMVDKMATAYQFRCCGRSSLVILIRFLSNFIYGLLPSNSGLSSNMGFVLRTITKMAKKISAAYQFAFVDTTLVICYLIASKFHTWITFI